MSSDYIPRLRHELLRAGAGKQARWRPARALRPLAAAAAVALVALAVALTLPSGGGDGTTAEPAPGELRLTYRVEPAAAERTAQVLRARLAAAGVDGAGVSVGSGASLTITAPEQARADVTALAEPGRLAVYDFEGSVLGSPEAVTRAEAEARAARRPDGLPVRDMAGRPGSWFALAGAPAITGADVASTRATVDEALQEPAVAIELTARGQAAFGTLTRDIARRGSAAAGGAPAGPEAFQHFAIVLDDRLLAMPYIDFHVAPDGIDGSEGMHIQGGLTADMARQIAAILSAGPLPAALSGPSAPPGG